MNWISTFTYLRAVSRAKAFSCWYWIKLTSKRISKRSWFRGSTKWSWKRLQSFSWASYTWNMPNFNGRALSPTTSFKSNKGRCWKYKASKYWGSFRDFRINKRGLNLCFRKNYWTDCFFNFFLFSASNKNTNSLTSNFSWFEWSWIYFRNWKIAFCDIKSLHIDNIRVVRLELTVSAWKADRLPLTDTRNTLRVSVQQSQCRIKKPEWIKKVYKQNKIDTISS